MLNDILFIFGYAILVASVLGVLYVFYKILAQGLKTFIKHDD